MGQKTETTAFRSRLTRFAGSERGSVTLFGVLFTILMIAMGGFAIDLLRYEALRTSIQNTLDRSTLAATSLTQKLDPAVVVNDYFAKAGLTSALKSVSITNGLNYRTVTAQAGAESAPIFMGMMGITSFMANGKSTAEQRYNNVEIMLVLDVSGSMGSNSKLTNLKSAANSFVSTVLKNDTDKKISIGIVPFNGQVNLGTTLAGYFNMTDNNSLTGSTAQAGVACADLPASVYSTYAIGVTTAISMTANVDTYSNSSATAPSEANKWCPGSTTYSGSPAGTGANIVRIPQQDITTLQGYINGLSAVGATSINAGMKWGMTLMDPSLRSLYTSNISAGRMPGTMSGRPYAYGAVDTMKVIVLMTDGENFAEDRVTPAYKTGASPIWLATDGRYSIFHASKVVNTNATTICNSRPFYVVHLAAWQSRPWNGTAPSNTACYVANPGTPYTSTTLQTWPQVWNALRMQYVAQTMYASPLGGTLATYLDQMRTQTPTTTMDSQLQTACTAAKGAGVVIYGIAFEAPTNGQTQILNCATGPGFYFDATGIQISTAFAAIANNISQLRLTQ